MSYKSDTPNQENISEILERLNQVQNEQTESIEEDIETNEELKNISENDLKELLMTQYIGQDDKARAKADETYYIDEDFMAEAKTYDEEELVDEEFIDEE